MQKNLFNVSVSCVNNSECKYDEADIMLDLTITNISQYAIGLPVTYFRKKGLHCLLVDNIARKKTAAHISLTPPSLKLEFTTIPPGESIHLMHEITTDDINMISGDVVDVTANLGISGFMLLDGEADPIPFSEDITINIWGNRKKHGGSTQK